MMSSSPTCAYLNDIRGCSVIAVYKSDFFVEIHYLKEGIQKSLSIESNDIRGVELPLNNTRQHRLSRKMTFEQLADIKTVIEINRYRNSSSNNELFEEIEIVYENEENKKRTYLIEFYNELQFTCKQDQPPSFQKIACDDKKLPQELFSVELYKTALAFALTAHGDQKTPHGLPYSYHIVSVATEVINSLSENRISYDEANVAVVCALLHDVLEDTETIIGTKTIDMPNIEIVLQGL